MGHRFRKDIQFYKFCAYGFLKNLRFFEAFLYLFFLSKGMSFFQIGLLVMVRELLRNILEIPSGIFADGWGRRKSMILSFILYILSFFAFYISGSFWMLLLAMIIFGCADAFRTGTHKAMIFDYLRIHSWEDQKTHYYGFTRSWSQIGSAISSLFAGVLVFLSGSYELIFLFTMVPYLIDLFLILSYPGYLDGEMSKSMKDHSLKNYLDMIKKAFKPMFEVRSLKALTNVSLYSGYYRAIKDYLQPLLLGFVVLVPIGSELEVEKRSAVIIGIIYFMIYLMNAFSSRKAGSLLGRAGSYSVLLNRTLLFGFLIGIGSGLFYSQSHTILMISSILVFMLIFVLENLRKPVGVAYLSDIFDQRFLATILSVESQMQSLFAALFAPIIGIVADSFGIRWALISLSLFLMCMVPFISLKSKSKP